MTKLCAQKFLMIVHLTVENDLWPHETLIFYFTSYLYHQNKSVDSLGLISGHFFKIFYSKILTMPNNEPPIVSFITRFFARFSVLALSWSWYFFVLVLFVPGNQRSWYFSVLALFGSGIFRSGYFLVMVLYSPDTFRSWCFSVLVLIGPGTFWSWYLTVLVLFGPWISSVGQNYSSPTSTQPLRGVLF